MARSGVERIGVLCVDDNPHVVAALRLKLARTESFCCAGWITDADDLAKTARRTGAGVVLLDLDMPGRDPLEATDELRHSCPEARVVVFSGHVREDLIDRALEAGAWGYASKNDGEEELLRVVRAVVGGEVAFSPEVRATLDRC